MKYSVFYPLIFISILLVGCSSGNYADLKDFVNDVRSQPVGKIKPLPNFAKYESFTYGAAGIRSPFQLRLISKVANSSAESTVMPDFERVKEPLEKFALSELYLVGTMTKPDGELWALIENNQSAVLAVKVGQHIGKNFGEITAITPEKVSVLEIVPDGPGRWIERPQTMILKGLANE